MTIPKITINQNVLVLLMGLLGIGFGEFYGLWTLYIISLVISLLMGFDVLRSMRAYTKHYVKNKLKL